MGTTLQLVLVLALIALALGYVLRATWKTWFTSGDKPGCGLGCGKCAA
ncbi:MAG: FeoB-associated Cys-rich membrane protein, partial [Gemmataceae bacterium]|nr:FeoB-associated Cys-rich membrane protein [Gemmataceae bacterium]